MANKQVYKSPHIDIIHQDIESLLLSSSEMSGSGIIHTGDGGIGEEEQLSKEFYFDGFVSETPNADILPAAPNIWTK